jgi:hypothetical protein
MQSMQNRASPETTSEGYGCIPGKGDGAFSDLSASSPFPGTQVRLLNDNRPLVFARLLGIDCISVPAFCALLYEKGQLTYPAIEGDLKRLAMTTSPVLHAEAERVVRHLASQRGESR